MLRARAGNAGKNPLWTSYEKLRTVIEKKMFSNTEELLPVISLQCQEQRRRAEEARGLRQPHGAEGLHAKQVRLLCEWYLRVRKSS